jgi:hypothetical protein
MPDCKTVPNPTIALIDIVIMKVKSIAPPFKIPMI